MRPYTGFDKEAKKKRVGTEHLRDIIVFLNAGKLSNLGSFVVRDKRGKPGELSVHSTGRAFDIGFSDRATAVRVMDWLVTNADLLDVEMVTDYFPLPFGRAWRCDRATWKKYFKKTVSGAPGGKWFHVEIGNRLADKGMEQAVKQALSG